jgi:ribonuclease BN (tRNA processing enzyme)
MEIKYSSINNGETYLKLKVGSQMYTLRGYSRAGLKTCILVEELNVGFDMGYSNERAFSYDNKLISHGHNDHIGALHYDHCARKLHKLEKEKLFIMPKQCIKPFKMITTAISEMNCGKSGENIKLFCNLLETKIVESEYCEYNYHYLIGSKQESEYVVKSFIMDHRIKSYGYIIYRKSKKLKKEFQKFSALEIVQLKHEVGLENLTEISYTPLVGYTGDTTIYGVIQHSEFLSVPLLIMECTGFNNDDHNDCVNNKHIHWNDIVNHYEKFLNEKIILFHFSQQYKTIDDIIQITQYSPMELQNKIIYFF